jgi:predicted Zn-dependent protease
MSNLMLPVWWALAALAAAATAESPEELIERASFRAARALLEKQPPGPRTSYLLARTLEAAGEYETALKLMEGAVAAEPGNADYHSLLAELCGYAAQKAGPFRGLGLARRFKRENEIALTLNPKHAEALHAVAMFYWEAPGLIGGDRNKARAAAEDLVRADPVRGYLTQAELASKEKNTARTEECHRKAVEADPKSVLARVARARFYLAAERYAEAETHARAAMALAPHRAAPYTILAQALASTGRMEALDAILAQSAQLVPNDLSPGYFAARRLLLMKRDPARAEALLLAYLAREPEYGAPSHEQARKLLAQVRNLKGF